MFQVLTVVLSVLLIVALVPKADIYKASLQKRLGPIT